MNCSFRFTDNWIGLQTLREEGTVCWINCSYVLDRCPAPLLYTVCVCHHGFTSLRQNTSGKIRTHGREIIGPLISSDSVLGRFWMPEFESQD